MSPAAMPACGRRSTVGQPLAASVHARASGADRANPATSTVLAETLHERRRGEQDAGSGPLACTSVSGIPDAHLALSFPRLAGLFEFDPDATVSSTRRAGGLSVPAPTARTFW